MITTNKDHDYHESTEESVKANNVPITPREVFRFQKSEGETSLKKPLSPTSF